MFQTGVKDKYDDEDRVTDSHASLPRQGARPSLRPQAAPCGWWLPRARRRSGRVKGTRCLLRFPFCI